MYSLSLLPKEIITIILDYAMNNDGRDIMKLIHICKIFREVLLERDENDYCYRLCVYNNTHLLKGLMVRESSNMNLIAYTLRLEGEVDTRILKKYVRDNVYLKEVVLNMKNIGGIYGNKCIFLNDLFGAFRGFNIVIRDNGSIIDAKNMTNIMNKYG